MNGADPVELTRRWLEDFVVRLGLCPFAAAPLQGGRVAYRLCGAADAESIYQAFLQALDELLGSDPGDIETTLLIVSAGLGSFDDYLDMLETLQEALAAAGAEGMVQLASFHPDYRFDGVDADDPANYTNRSPLPMFHLIREDGLAAVLESFPDAQGIPARNVALLRRMGLAGIRACLAGEPLSGE